MTTGQANFVYDATKAGEKYRIANRAHNAEIVAAQYSLSKNGNHQIALKWRIVDGDDTDKTVKHWLTFNQNTVDIIEQFMRAIGRSTRDDLHGKTIDEAFLTDYAETLLGEMASITTEMQPIKRDGSTIDTTTGEPYGDAPNVKRVAPYGATKSADTLLDLD
jgi:hypothetical protein